jgi:hypothetical protein
LKRGQRERKGVVGQGVSLSDLQRKRRRNKRERRKELFGRNSFEFLNFQNLDQVVVVVC